MDYHPVHVGGGGGEGLVAIIGALCYRTWDYP